jgi:hypothetical protein
MLNEYESGIRRARRRPQEQPSRTPRRAQSIERIAEVSTTWKALTELWATRSRRAPTDAHLARGYFPMRSAQIDDQCLASPTTCGQGLPHVLSLGSR